MVYKMKSGLSKLEVNDFFVVGSWPSFEFRIDDLASVKLVTSNVRGIFPKLSFIDKSGMSEEFEISDKNMQTAKEILQFLWSKIGISNDKDAEKKFEDVINSIPKSYMVDYLGGHPLCPDDGSAVIAFREDSLEFQIFGGGNDQAFSIPFNRIKKVSIQTEKEVRERYTATRIALFGPLALAMKKRKVNIREYLVIDCDDCSIVLAPNASLMKDIYEEMQKHPAQVSNAPSSEMNKYDEIKKLKELLDEGILTQEEFESKKKQLLGL